MKFLVQICVQLHCFYNNKYYGQRCQNNFYFANFIYKSSFVLLASIFKTKKECVTFYKRLIFLSGSLNLYSCFDYLNQLYPPRECVITVTNVSVHPSISFINISRNNSWFVEIIQFLLFTIHFRKFSEFEI